MCPLKQKERNSLAAGIGTLFRAARQHRRSVVDRKKIKTDISSSLNKKKKRKRGRQSRHGPEGERKTELWMITSSCSQIGGEERTG